MSKLHEKRMRCLKLVKEGKISREFLKNDDELNTSLIDTFKKETLIKGDLNSLQLTNTGYSVLSQMELLKITEDLDNSVGELQEATTEFKESTEKQNQKMLLESKTMNRLTWAVLIATITNLGITAYQVIL